MAAKTRLTQGRDELRPLIDILDDAIESCMRSIERRGVKPTAADLVHLIRLRLEVKPIKQPSQQCTWVDNPPGERA